MYLANAAVAGDGFVHAEAECDSKSSSDESDGVGQQMDAVVRSRMMCVVCSITRASFALPGSTRAERCLSCRLDGDINVRSSKCAVCLLKEPSFAQPGSARAERCLKCKLDGDINVRSSKCAVCLLKQPSFAQPGTTRAERCSGCKLDGDINVRSKMCLVCLLKEPSFAQPGSTRAERCLSCRLDGDIDVRSKMCAVCLVKNPSFAQPSSTRAERCLKCKLDGDINVRSSKCAVCLLKEPFYAEPGTTRAERCSGCKLDGDINVRSKMCLVCLLKEPSFAQPGSGRAERCLSCKLDGDVNVRKPKCSATGCPAFAAYGLLFGSITHCQQHKNDSMLHQRRIRPKCAHQGCKERPAWTDQANNYPLRCEQHRSNNDTNVAQRACAECKQIDFIKEGNLCNICFTFHMRKHTKVKELMVKVLLEANKIEFRHDMRPEGGCYQARPDFVIDCGTHIIIIEVDEFQHKHSNYPCECEQTRTINLYQEYGGLPVLFVRYNPDSYLDMHGRKCSGWTVANRKRLIQVIQHSMAQSHSSPLVVRYVCFDGDDGRYQEFVIDYEIHILSQMEALDLSSSTIGIEDVEEKK